MQLTVVLGSVRFTPMALVKRRVLSSVSAVKGGGGGGGGGGGWLRPQSASIPPNLRRSFSNSPPPPPNPLFRKLLQLPRSQIKSTLDHEATVSALQGSHFSWDSLFSSLRSSSPIKAHLVLEWRLEAMLDDNEMDHNQYSNLISLSAKVKNVSFAMRVFTSMEAQGIEPNPSDFNSLIHTCLSSSNVITALSLFEIMESSQQFKPDSQTYDVFISGFSNLRDAGKMKAWYVAKRAAGFSTNLGNYESLISGSVKTRNFDDADSFYEEMMSSGIMPSRPVLEYVLEGLCKRKECVRVKEFVKFLLECRFQISGNMIDEVVGLYSELGRADEMEELLKNLTEFDQATEALLHVHCGIIGMYAMLNRLDDVEYSVGRMMSQGISFRNPGDIEKVICSYFREEAYDRLDLFLEYIKRYYKLTTSTYDLLVSGYRRAGLTEKLDLVMKDMKLSA